MGETGNKIDHVFTTMKLGSGHTEAHDIILLPVCGISHYKNFLNHRNNLKGHTILRSPLFLHSTLYFLSGLCLSSWHLLECPLIHSIQSSKPLQKLFPPPDRPPPKGNCYSQNFRSNAPSPVKPSRHPPPKTNTHNSPRPSRPRSHQMNCNGLPSCLSPHWARNGS